MNIPTAGIFLEEYFTWSFPTGTLLRNAVVGHRPGLSMATMPQDREVDWRTCPTCREEYPWRKDTHPIWKVCRFCAVTESTKTAVALATAGQGTGFGNQGGKR